MSWVCKRRRGAHTQSASASQGGGDIQFGCVTVCLLLNRQKPSVACSFSLHSSSLTLSPSFQSFSSAHDLGRDSGERPVHKERGTREGREREQGRRKSTQVCFTGPGRDKAQLHIWRSEQQESEAQESASQRRSCQRTEKGGSALH